MPSTETLLHILEDLEEKAQASLETEHKIREMRMEKHRLDETIKRIVIQNELFDCITINKRAITTMKNRILNRGM